MHLGDHSVILKNIPARKCNLITFRINFNPAQFPKSEIQNNFHINPISRQQKDEKRFGIKDKEWAEVERKEENILLKDLRSLYKNKCSDMSMKV